MKKGEAGKKKERKGKRRVRKGDLEVLNFYVLHFPFYLICTLLSPLLRGAT